MPSKNTYKGIRINLYSIMEKKNLLIKNAPLIWELVNSGLEIFEKLFGVPYPFKKCDVIFVMEVSANAMENPGLIVFDSKYLYEEDVEE